MTGDQLRALGARVRTLRTARGLSQERLAAHVGMNRSSVANMEAGRQNINVARLLQVAEALAVNPAALLTDPPPAAPDGCPFCDIVAGTGHADVVREWPDTIAIIPLDPVTSGHTLVIPKKHVVDFSADPEVSATTMRRAAELMRWTTSPMNVITSRGPEATQTVFHLHLHLVPRRAGDGLALPWSPRGGTS